MRIIILGAGQVGGTLARNLVHEKNDITVIDLNEERLRDLQHRLDIQTVYGSASHPASLIEAGIEQADMLIAVTDSDEINMIGCQIAYSLFRTPLKIARIRAQTYYDYPELFGNNALPVDVCISPEKLVTQHIVKLIAYPGANQVLEFANGHVVMVTIKPQAPGMMTGQTIQALYDHLNQPDICVIAIFRDKKAIKLHDQCDIQCDDVVLFIAPPLVVHQVMIALGCYACPNRRIIIGGGGHIGAILAQTLENNYRIKIIEQNTKRAHLLASTLHKSTILQGDIADRELLINENIEFTDVFCAVNNDDEANIMSCLQAKHLGVRHTMALVNRNAYVELIEDSKIDQAISPQLITIGCILTQLRGGNMVKVHRLQHSGAEAIELIIHGDKQTSKVVGRQLHQIKLPNGCSIVALIHNNKLAIAQPQVVIQSGDHVILLILRRQSIRQIESLFQVNLAFVD